MAWSQERLSRCSADVEVKTGAIMGPFLRGAPRGAELPCFSVGANEYEQTEGILPSVCLGLFTTKLIGLSFKEEEPKGTHLPPESDSSTTWRN